MRGPTSESMPEAMLRTNSSTKRKSHGLKYFIKFKMTNFVSTFRLP